MSRKIRDTNWEVLIWLGSILVLLFVVLFATHSYRIVEEEMAAQFNREQSLLAQQTAMGIQQYMGYISNVLSLTTQIPDVARGDEEAIRPALGKAYASLKNKVAFIFWEDAEGILRHHHPRQVLPGLDGKDFSFRTYFRVVKEMRVPFVSNIIMVGGEQHDDIPGRFETFVMAYPLVDDDGVFRGLIGCAIDLANITAHYVAPIKPSASGYAWLLDETGTLLYHPDPRLPGLNLFDLVMSLRKQGVGISGMDEISHGMELKNDGRYIFVFPHYPSNEPTRKLLAFSSAHFLNRRWITAVTSPYSEIIHLMSGTFRNTLILGSASIILVLVATVVLLRINKARAKASERGKWADRVLVAHRRLEALFNGMPHSLVLIDDAFTISDVNRGSCELFGHERGEIVGRHCQVDFAPAENICALDLVEQCFKTGEIVTVSDRNLEFQGLPRSFDISVIPLFGARGEVEYVVQYAVDVTEKKALTEHLIQAEKMAAVGQVAAHMAHEIRNPLTSVMLHSELLEEELIPEGGETPELLGIIRDEIDRLSEITEEYLAYARLPHPKKQTVDPALEVSKVMAMLKPDLVRRGITVALSSDHVPRTLLIDRGQFRQVLINLMKNASDAMPSGGALEIAVTEMGDHFILKVRDNGYGIPEDIQQRIFDPYFTTKEHGTGLGLALVQYIANAHDGRVAVESSPGQGSVFTFTIPANTTEREKEIA